MIIGRRQFVQAGGGFLVALALPIGVKAAAEPIEVAMSGTRAGAYVWFDPVGVLVQPGQAVRWTNRDRGNAHTTTAYHPDNLGRERRMPRSATPWNSGYLRPGESFAVTFTVPGVYDYYCMPHEMAGMAGRIVVGSPASGDWDPEGQGDLPDAAFHALPSISDIMARGAVARDPET